MTDDEFNERIAKMCAKNEVLRASLPPGMVDELDALEREYQKGIEELARNDQKGSWPFNSSHSPERGKLYRDFCRKMTEILRKYQPLREQVDGKTDPDDP